MKAPVASGQWQVAGFGTSPFRVLYGALLALQLVTCHLSLTWGAAFEPLGYGAAAKGMGGAYTAAADNGYAAYWNPAGLGLVKNAQLTSSYEDLYGLGLMRYTAVGYTQPQLGGGTAGFHFLRLKTVGEARFFTYAENIYLLSYGRHVYRPFYLGGNLRFYSVASEQRATGMGYDLGFLYRPSVNDRFRAGLTVQDMNEPRIRWGTGAVDVLPPTIRLGVFFRLGPISDFSVEQNWRRHEQQTYRFGMAHHLMNRFFVLRAGVHRASRQDRWNAAVGGGFRFRRFDLDYAWDAHEELGSTQTLAVSFRFGK